MKSFGVFVIAYNARQHIEKTLSRIHDEVWQRTASVFLVDGCSLDELV